MLFRSLGVINKTCYEKQFFSAELQRAKRASEAPLVRTTGNPISQENWDMTSPYGRPSPIQVVGKGEECLNVDFKCSQLIRFIYLLRSLSHQNLAKSELVSTHNKNGIIEKNTRAKLWSYAF